MTNTAESAVLADRDEYLTDGIRDLLGTVFRNVFVVSDARSLLEGVVRLRPDVVVMDLSIAPTDATDLIRRIKAGANPAVIVLTLHDAPDLAKQLLDAGADAIVSKHRLAIDLLAAVDTVLELGRYVSSGIALSLLGHGAKHGGGDETSAPPPRGVHDK